MDNDWTWEGMLAHVSTAWQKILFDAVKLQFLIVNGALGVNLHVSMKHECLTVFYNYFRRQNQCRQWCGSNMLNAAKWKLISLLA